LLSTEQTLKELEKFHLTTSNKKERDKKAPILGGFFYLC
jgi:hypothetical protein